MGKCLDSRYDLPAFPEDSSRGWAHYAAQLAALAGDPPGQRDRGFDDIARGCPIGTDAWKKARAREYQHRALNPTSATHPDFRLFLGLRAL